VPGARVIQAGQTEELSRPGSSDHDEAASCGDVEDLVDLELGAPRSAGYRPSVSGMPALPPPDAPE
jgi:hypothetical protein